MISVFFSWSELINDLKSIILSKLIWIVKSTWFSKMCNCKSPIKSHLLIVWALFRLFSETQKIVENIMKTHPFTVQSQQQMKNQRPITGGRNQYPQPPQNLGRPITGARNQNLFVLNEMGNPLYDPCEIFNYLPPPEYLKVIQCNQLLF